MNKFNILSICSCLILSSLNASVSNEYYNNSKDGYFYYKDDVEEPKKKKKKKLNKENKNKVNTTFSEYNKTHEMLNMPFENEEQRAERIKKEDEFMANIPYHKLDDLSVDEYKRLLDITRNISTARPNKEYVKAYAAVQKFWVDKSERFAKIWGVANLEDPEALLYSNIGWTSRDRKNIKENQKQADKEFFNRIKSRAGFIVVLKDKKDKKIYNSTKSLYDKVKDETGLDYLIYDYYEITPALKQKLKITQQTLPDNILLYINHRKEKIYKRVMQGFGVANKVIRNTKFIFENAILEKDKHPKDRIKRKAK